MTTPTRRLTVTRAADTEAPRASDTPDTARVVGLDGDENEMFPLQRPKEAAKKLGISPQWLHALADQGDLQYVLIPSTTGSDKEGHRRRFRCDHLRQFAEGATVT